MSRRLSPEETKLWAQVAATAKPLGKRAVPMPAPKPGPVGLMPWSPRSPQPMPAPPVPSSPRVGPSPEAATLDRTWDRKLRTGAVLPDLIIDLHGHSRDRAFDVLARALARAHQRRDRLVLVVTGKGRTASDSGGGVLRAALPGWLETPSLRPYVAALRTASPRHGGAGAWYVILRRVRGVS